MGFTVEEKFRIILVMKEVNLTNVKVLCAVGILKTELSAYHKSLIEVQMFN